MRFETWNSHCMTARQIAKTCTFPYPSTFLRLKRVASSLKVSNSTTLRCCNGGGNNNNGINDNNGDDDADDRIRSRSGEDNLLNGYASHHISIDGRSLIIEKWKLQIAPIRCINHCDVPACVVVHRYRYPECTQGAYELRHCCSH